MFMSYLGAKQSANKHLLFATLGAYNTILDSFISIVLGSAPNQIANSMDRVGCNGMPSPLLSPFTSSVMRFLLSELGKLLHKW
jgi:hypothetical protein